ncbi:MAG: hypothetical protein FWF78_02875 [Defluviitaleaceae bacterium]|nr:hypothetical protein [Defluviitaleaceae bacterium]
MNRKFAPMYAAEMMDRVFDVYKKSFWNQVAFAAIVSVMAFMVFFLVAIIVAVIFALVMVAGLAGGAIDDVSIFLLIGIIVVVMPFIMVWQAFSSSGHILLSRQAFYGYRSSLSHMGIFKVIFRVFTAILAQILIAIPFIVLAFLIIMVAFTTGATFFVVPAILLGLGYWVFSNMFSISVAVAAFERRYFFGAIMRSWELIKPDFWKIFGIRAVWMSSVFIFSLSAQGIFMLFNMLLGLLAETAPIAALFSILGIMFMSFVGPMIASFLVAPLDGIMQSLIYFNQRMKHEGFDLELRLETL